MIVEKSLQAVKNDKGDWEYHLALEKRTLDVRRYTIEELDADIARLDEEKARLIDLRQRCLSEKAKVEALK